MEEIDWLARRPYSCVVSCELDLNLDYLVEKLWEHLCLIRIYTKKRGEYPDFSQGLILQKGISVEDAVSRG
jgi:ribosome-interacting GTPase 1